MARNMLRQLFLMLHLCLSNCRAEHLVGFRCSKLAPSSDTDVTEDMLQCNYGYELFRHARLSENLNSCSYP